MTIKDMTGLVFERLTVLSHAGFDKHRNAMWLCACSCGTRVTAGGHRLRRGHTRSCGCLVADTTRTLRTTHGTTANDASPPTYNTWVNVTQRCTNPKVKCWANYGGRGITICDRWRDFANFLADMGERPDGMSIERVDNDGDYCPENCIWSDRKTQGRNKRDTVYITIRGERLSLRSVCEAYGVSYSPAWWRHTKSETPLTEEVLLTMKRKAEKRSGRKVQESIPRAAS